MVRCLRWVAILLTLSIFVGRSGAQTPGAEYKLRAGDVLSIDVWGFKDLSVSAVPVRPDGKISYPTIGEIYVVDMTPAALSRIITLGMSKYIKAPKISVTLLSSAAERFFVTGAVVKPGGFPLTVNTGVREAVAAAGDLTPDADNQNASVLRNGQRIQVDLAAAMKGDASKNIMLQAGDTVSIDQALITLEGAVNGPGKQPLRRGTTLRQALASAGDVRDNADIERIQILRGKETIVANLREITANPEKDVPLMSGDIIKVDPADIRTVPVLITGSVGHSGTFRFVPGYRDTVQDAITWAGGLGSDADLNRVKILRTDSSGKSSEIICDIRKTEGRSVHLQANDYLEVPKRKRSQAFTIASGFLGIGVSLYSIFKNAFP